MQVAQRVVQNYLQLEGLFYDPFCLTAKPMVIPGFFIALLHPATVATLSGFITELFDLRK